MKKKSGIFELVPLTAEVNFSHVGMKTKREMQQIVCHSSEETDEGNDKISVEELEQELEIAIVDEKRDDMYGGQEILKKVRDEAKAKGYDELIFNW